MTPEAIKAARINAGLSHDQAARVCYVHPRTWWRWERGESAMPRAVWELFTLRQVSQVVQALPKLPDNQPG